ncbi:unnamed protein product [Mucor hiemalis]
MPAKKSTKKNAKNVKKKRKKKNNQKKNNQKKNEKKKKNNNLFCFIFFFIFSAILSQAIATQTIAVSKFPWLFFFSRRGTGAVRERAGGKSSPNASPIFLNPLAVIFFLLPELPLTSEGVSTSLSSAPESGTRRRSRTTRTKAGACQSGE